MVQTNGINAAPGQARRFGLSLVVLSLVMLLVGIGYTSQFMVGLRHMRRSMTEEGLIHGRERSFQCR